jgi:hypothetical protein
MMDTLAKHQSANVTTVYNLSLTNEQAGAR